PLLHSFPTRRSSDLTTVATIKVTEAVDGEDPTDPVKEIELDGEEVEVQAGTEIQVKNTGVTIKLPEDLPEGTTVKVHSVESETLETNKNLEIAGEVY